MAEQKEPILFRENGPSSYPPRQHHQRNHHGNQEQNVGGFPNQYFADVHCRLSITKSAAPLLSFPVPVHWPYRLKQSIEKAKPKQKAAPAQRKRKAASSDS